VHRNPLSQYRALTGRGDFTPDSEQLGVVEALDALWRNLEHQRNPGFLDRLLKRSAPPDRGIYLWGGVGRGKTWLMDLFFDELPVRRKQRIHFHRFMQRIHHALRELGDIQDPLTRVAAEWSGRCSVLCLDEFFVSDIADAMLLGGLLGQLFERGVTLVATSNIDPDNLYRDGLQRARFLPAIRLIKENMQVLELAGDTDYRLRILEQSEIFHHPLDAAAERQLTASFDRMAADCELDHQLEINGRAIHARRRGDGVIWFDFTELCGKPRGAIDYIEIARAFNTVMISDIPRLSENDADATRRFITLIDEFYDRNVKLLLSAAAPVRHLYSGDRLAFEFERTASRLTEMQSHDYLAKPHLP
jgi:cell division protein ZapE